MHRVISQRGTSTVVRSFDGKRGYIVVKDEGIHNAGYGQVFISELEIYGAATHRESMTLDLSHDHAAMVRFLYDKFKCSKETTERIIFAIRQV